MDGSVNLLSFRGQDKHRRTSVWLRCESCGKAYVMPAWDVERRKRQAEARKGLPNARSTGGYGILRFCRKACRLERAVAYIKENPTARNYQIQDMFGVSPQSVSKWRGIAKRED